MDAIVVWCTVPDAALGTTIADAVVGEGLAACVNRVPGVVSTYRWQGELCRDEEQLLLIKTRAGSFDALRARIRALHPYDTPEIIALPVAAGDDDYLNWIASSLRTP